MNDIESLFILDVESSLQNSNCRGSDGESFSHFMNAIFTDDTAVEEIIADIIQSSPETIKKNISGLTSNTLYYIILFSLQSFLVRYGCTETEDSESHRDYF